MSGPGTRPRHLLSSRQAADYCGFRTTGALRKAHMQGRIFPAGRRGGAGTWMLLNGTPGTPPDGGEYEGETVEKTVEHVDQPQASPAWGLQTEGGGIPRSRTTPRPRDGETQRNQAHVAGGHRSEGRAKAIGRRARTSSDDVRAERCDAAILRLRDLLARAKDHDRRDQERAGSGEVGLDTRAPSDPTIRSRRSG